MFDAINDFIRNPLTQGYMIVLIVVMLLIMIVPTMMITTESMDNYNPAQLTAFGAMSTPASNTNATDLALSGKAIGNVFRDDRFAPTPFPYPSTCGYVPQGVLTVGVGALDAAQLAAYQQAYISTPGGDMEKSVAAAQAAIKMGYVPPENQSAAMTAAQLARNYAGASESMASKILGMDQMANRGGAANLYKVSEYYGNNETTGTGTIRGAYINPSSPVDIIGNGSSDFSGAAKSFSEQLQFRSYGQA